MMSVGAWLLIPTWRIGGSGFTMLFSVPPRLGCTPCAMASSTRQRTGNTAAAAIRPRRDTVIDFAPLKLPLEWTLAFTGLDRQAHPSGLASRDHADLRPSQPVAAYAAVLSSARTGAREF